MNGSEEINKEETQRTMTQVMNNGNLSLQVMNTYIGRLI